MSYRNKKIKQIGSFFLLGLIVLFGMFLRYEDFSIWKKYEANFKYQGAYQMGNFDSYIYLQQAKEVVKGEYDTLDEKRRFPNGVKRGYFPPLISLVAATVSQVTGIPLANVAIFTPVVLAPLLAILVFFLCLALGLNRTSALVAALFSVLSITYIVRTRIGVFDTDCLNVTFLLLTSYLLLQFASIKNKKRYAFLVGGIVSFVVHSWIWNSAVAIVFVSFIVPLSAAILFFFKTEKKILKYLVLLAIVVVGLVLNYDEFSTLFKLLVSNESVFPDNVSVSELDAITLSTFVEKTTHNWILVVIGLAGLTALIYKHKIKVLILSIPILLGFSPLLLGVRFLVFSAPIIALGLACGVQYLFNQRKINTKIPYAVAIALIGMGLFSAYKPITKSYAKPAAIENTILLNAIQKKVPKDATVWTSVDLGYQILYYLDIPTYGDGEFTGNGMRNGELHYNMYYPFAAQKFSLSANFIQFYSVQGVAGMRKLEEMFNGIEHSYTFLQTVLPYPPKESRAILQDMKQQNVLPQSDTLTSIEDWLLFLYPKPTKEIYVLIYYKMTQTVSWFKQGNSDLKTQKTKGLPMFLTLQNLQERTDKITNNQIAVNTKTGASIYNKSQRNFFHSITTYGDTLADVKTFPKNRARTKNRFIFQWNKKNKFGVILDEEMQRMTLPRLFIGNEKSNYFVPVDLKTPAYQLWKVQGDRYEK